MCGRIRVDRDSLRLFFAHMKRAAAGLEPGFLAFTNHDVRPTQAAPVVTYTGPN